MDYKDDRFEAHPLMKIRYIFYHIKGPKVLKNAVKKRLDL